MIVSEALEPSAKTGDSDSRFLWVLLALSGVTVVLLSGQRRKRKPES